MTSDPSSLAKEAADLVARAEYEEDLSQAITQAAAWFDNEYPATAPHIIRFRRSTFGPERIDRCDATVYSTASGLTQQLLHLKTRAGDLFEKLGFPLTPEDGLSMSIREYGRADSLSAHEKIEIVSKLNRL